MNEVTRNHFARSGLCPSCFFEKGEAQICPACGYNLAAAESDWNRLRPGTVLHERYVVGGTLGQGGFGVTYLGMDMLLHTRLAVKEYYPSGIAARNSTSRSVMHASGDLAEDFRKGMEKFLEEARTLARFVEHPNVVSVRDFFEENGTAYMVMNFVDGKTLLEHMKERGGRIPFDEAITILSPLMDALDEIHASGTILRDLSPDNIFLTRFGQPKLLDFGASKSALALMQQRSHSVILKRGYSPPEQYQSRGRLGPWTDVYGMAATFYRCITGEPPADAMDRMGEDALMPPRKRFTTIPGHADSAIVRALSISAEDRPQSMREFGEELRGKRQPSSSNSHSSVAVRQYPPQPKPPGIAKIHAPLAASLSPSITARDGSNLLFIPVSEFVMGDGKSPDNPKHRVWLDNFYIGKYCVTNEQYDRFLKETGHSFPAKADWKGHWYPQNKADHPAVNVSWEDAMAYAIWAGCELPTEAQWEKAARGPNGYVYPWSNVWDPSKCRRSQFIAGGTAPVDAYPQGVSGYGTYQQAGNVWEWCYDWYEKEYFWLETAKRNPKGPSSASNRVNRGGGWLTGNPAFFLDAQTEVGVNLMRKGTT